MTLKGCYFHHRSGAVKRRSHDFGPITSRAVHQAEAAVFPVRPGIRRALAGRCYPLLFTNNMRRRGEGGKTVEHGGGEKLKPDPVPAHKAQGYVRGMGAIIALPKNKRGKMTVEDTVTKSSTGQIGGPAL